MRLSIVAIGVILAAGAAWAKPGDAPATATANAGKGNMLHCPTSVNGAKTAVSDIKDGIELTVTADNEKATAEVRQRAQHLVTASRTDPNTVRHSGDGHGGGGIGICPVVLKDTLVTAEDVKGGSKITVRPIKPVDLEWLRKETNTRMKSAKK
jgi:TusA-related sulfurtransferase